MFILTRVLVQAGLFLSFKNMKIIWVCSYWIPASQLQNISNTIGIFKKQYGFHQEIDLYGNLEKEQYWV